MLELLVLFGLVNAVGGACFGKGPNLTSTLVRCVLVTVVLIGGLSMFRIWVRFLPFMLIGLVALFIWMKSQHGSSPQVPKAT